MIVGLKDDRVDLKIRLCYFHFHGCDGNKQFHLRSRTLELMDIRRSFEILELHHAATEAEARQAYKDIVSVWHPDRFCNNQRLKQKAEKKLQEVNAAYETVKVFLQNSDHNESEIHKNATARSKTEIAAEISTGIVLGVCSYISGKLRNIIERD